jgi:hypothetical protein
VAVIGSSEGAGLGEGTAVQREGIQVHLGAEQLVDADLGPVSSTGQAHTWQRTWRGLGP